MARAKLRHVAISTADPDRTAAWYQAVFGLEVAGRTHSGGYYLTDGDCNFAVLSLRAPDDPTRIRTGVDHFGFVVEDPEATYRLLAALRRAPSGCPTCRSATSTSRRSSAAPTAR